MSTPDSPLPRWLQGPRPAVVGHRGAAAKYPENTLASFRGSLGADAVETDVQLSADLVPFLLHDDTLARTTDAESHGIEAAAPASTVPWDVLRRLDAGSWFEPAADGTPAGLPTLDDLADLLIAADDQGAPLGLDLEVKSPVGHAPETVVAVLREAFASPRWERLVAADAVLVTSFDPEVVQLAGELLPVPVGLLTVSAPAPEDVEALESLAAIITAHEDLTLETVTAAHDAGLVVGVYTANEPEDWDRLIALGVDLIVTDDPHRLRRHLGR